MRGTFCAFLFLSIFSFGQELTKLPSTTSLAESWKQAIELGARSHAVFCVSYEIQGRFIPRQVFWGRGIFISSEHRTSWGELLSGKPISQVDQRQRPFAKLGQVAQVGPVLLQFQFLVHQGNANLVDFEVGGHDDPVRHDHPIIWLGRRPVDESFRLISLLANDLVEQMMAPEVLEMIAVHPNAEATQWLKRRSLENRSETIRREAVEQLAILDNEDALGLAMKVSREDASVRVRSSAFRTIGELGTVPAMEHIIQFGLTDRAPRVRRSAVDALADFKGERVEQAIYKLLETETSHDVLEEALEVVVETLHDTELLEEIVLGNRLPQLRESAVEIYADLLPGKAFDMLKRVVNHKAPNEVKSTAIECMADLPAAVTLPTLKRLAKSRDMGMSCAALEAIGDYNGRESIEFLFQFAMAHSGELAEEAVDALGHMDNPDALDVLIQIGATHPENEIRDEALEHVADCVFDS